MLKQFFLAQTLFFITTACIAQTVSYRVTFTGTWNANDSSDYPGSAHFTELIGATHSAGNAIWNRGELASPGVEDVAEFGATFNIQSELAATAQSGTTGPVVILSSLFNLPNSDVKEVVFTEDKPNISLISMLAPSPDWFVGVSDLSLRADGQWLEELSVDLHPYDAGTVDGDTFQLGGQDTSPRQPIALIGESPFFLEMPVVGQLTFELLTPIEPPTTEPPAPNPAPTNSDTGKQSIPALIQLLLEE